MSRIPSRVLHSSVSRFLSGPSPSELKTSVVLLARLIRTNIPQSKLCPSADGSIAFPWNALLSTISRNGFPSISLRVFSFMHRHCIPLDSYSWCSSLAAAAALLPPDSANLGGKIHAYVSKSGETASIFVGGALIGFYVRTDRIQDAHKVFDDIPARNIVCLNALLNGYVGKKLWMEGLSLFRMIHKITMEPDCVTISAVLKICAEVSAIGLGKECHARLVRNAGGMEKDSFLLSSLVEMYGKLGLAGNARLVFDTWKQGTEKGGIDVVLWTSLLNSYGRNGQFDDVILTFEEMILHGTKPDEILMLVVLSACARSGNVIKGLFFFESMMNVYGLVPTREHYSCVVDMLCRAGELEKAWNFVNQMALEDDGNGGTLFDVSAWGAILSACSASGEVKVGKVAFERAMEMYPDNIGIHMELSKLYARVGMWDDHTELRKLMWTKGMKKDAGCSRLEIVN
ncbi:hypothetical protein HPP92_027087 [Vanilla planifolia]|uniref:Pentatricopeptide repeat-containing protein n=1 Tax=Vanilla planifolia TaxID=51239 RepID=A0A835PA52_VANPL|nr:hypothetical protein HPP92_027087 [Vanilla planifolia]